EEGVLRDEPDRPPAYADLLDGQLAVQRRHDDVPALRLDGPIHHQHVARVDARTHHRLALDGDEVSGDRVLDDELVEVERLVDVVVGGGGGAGRGAGQQERAGVGGGRGGRGEGGGA